MKSAQGRVLEGDDLKKEKLARYSWEEVVTRILAVIKCQYLTQSKN